ncbi:ABC transporter substrate-binding protein [Pseudonocardia cypriaca]|uniref:Carbohydrate ABC transporter substrate-binding protein (CUT1 family) n=1 Tax=Pseudonocardia cypriaca TaxID=882449 RepID=A0A543GCH0_9PSEU|nr:ABC transporter substrate-binding protein [Pseudonocardia cypriaca]TQM43777.1 carbohydrate ABC transporter substrate-binding protein (CUT1 family) [Pseudonocardia cypriaca]
MRPRPVGLPLLAAFALAAGCSSADSQSREAPAAPPAAVAAAEAAARAVARDQQVGGTVSVLGVLGGEELDAFLAVLEPFERATGVDVEYEGTRDFAAVLRTRVDGGNPPDVVVTPAIGEMAALAAEGRLADLRTVVGEDVLAAAYAPSILDATRAADGAVFGIFDTVNLGGLAWFNPRTYDGPRQPESWQELQDWAAAKAARGETPWCVGLESGAASGWPAADLVDEILLRQAGPEFHERWRRGAEPWTAPQVRRAFETYGAVVAEGAVYGGPTTALSTGFDQAANPMLADDPGCDLLAQAAFMGGIITDSFPELTPVEDLDFFPVPDFDPQHPDVRAISGEIAGVLTRTPQSDALVRYLATAESGALVAATGRWLSPHVGLSADAYTDPFLRRAHEVLATARAVHPLGNALMPQSEVDAFWQAGLRYTEHPDQLDAILQTLQAVRDGVR